MPDDRAIEDLIATVARLSGELKDLRDTSLARAASRPTGDVEMTIRTVAKAGTLLCQGQTASRATYPILWQFAQEQGLVIAGMFTVGDGSTTFGLPDFRGRVPMGVGTLGADTYVVGSLGGSAARTLSLANMPVHDHNVSVNSGGGHAHGGTTANNAGGHGGHASGTANVVPPGSGVTLPSFYNSSGGDHGHNISTDTEPAHGHTTNESSAGSGSAFDNRPPYVGVNWLIYT